jgi:ABC-type transport system involved in cytochrome bd biosynthesis fused ATPase/permease subunit
MSASARLLVLAYLGYVYGPLSRSRQRLRIARAFLEDARVLILDEPTLALDTIAERQIVGAVRRL